PRPPRPSPAPCPVPSRASPLLSTTSPANSAPRWALLSSAPSSPAATAAPSTASWPASPKKPPTPPARASPTPSRSPPPPAPTPRASSTPRSSPSSTAGSRPCGPASPSWPPSSYTSRCAARGTRRPDRPTTSRPPRRRPPRTPLPAEPWAGRGSRWPAPGRRCPEGRPPTAPVHPIESVDRHRAWTRMTELAGLASPPRPVDGCGTRTSGQILPCSGDGSRSGGSGVEEAPGRAAGVEPGGQGGQCRYGKEYGRGGGREPGARGYHHDRAEQREQAEPQGNPHRDPADGGQQLGDAERRDDLAGGGAQGAGDGQRTPRLHGGAPADEDGVEHGQRQQGHRDTEHDLARQGVADVLES